MSQSSEQVEGDAVNEAELAELRKEMQDIQSKFGELEWAVLWAVEVRWVKNVEASYPHEIAWVLGKPVSLVEKALKTLESKGEVEYGGYGNGELEKGKKYKPTRREIG
jgi:hypothetical protein